ncbi:hypothetical protein G6F56_002171 [Rhizopus delemar]|nr:hypothetical protein G6F56_002171 [Rhizopus delemar]
MPKTYIIECLGPERGDHFTMTKLNDSECPILVCVYRDLKPKALVSSCSTSVQSNKYRYYLDRSGNQKQIRPPQVFDDYEFHKSSVDTANNRRDNMISFHDVMKTYRWDIRFLSFTLGIAEANAFSCYKIWGKNNEGMMHAEFKDRLARTLLQKVQHMSEGVAETSLNTMRLRREDRDGSHAYISLSFGNKQRRLICKSCKNRE